MKKGIVFTAAFRILGIVVLILGVRMMGEGIYNYINEHHQADWINTTAYVIDVEKEYSNTTRNRHTSYDITYEYTVDGNTYTDTLYNRGKPMDYDDEISIKYDPESPENSTNILKPSVHNLIIFIIFSIILTTVGFFLSGLWAFIQRLCEKNEPKEEYLP